MGGESAVLSLLGYHIFLLGRTIGKRVSKVPPANSLDPRYCLLCPHHGMEEQSNISLIIGIYFPRQNDDTILYLLVQWQKK